MRADNAGFTLYWLRRSRITDLVEARNLPVPLPTIAEIAGTSTPIMEQTYYHPQDLHEALDVPGIAYAAAA